MYIKIHKNKSFLSLFLSIKFIILVHEDAEAYNSNQNMITELPRNLVGLAITTIKISLNNALF